MPISAPGKSLVRSTRIGYTIRVPTLEAKMLRLINIAAPCTFAAYLALNTPAEGPFHGLVAGTVVALLWDGIGTIVKRVHRKDRDTALLAGGYCPACEKAMTLEVTSEPEAGITNIQCTACDEHYTVTATPNGPLVSRNGKGYTYEHD